MVENRISTVQWQLLLKQWGKEVQDGGKVLGTGDDKVVMLVTPPKPMIQVFSQQANTPKNLCHNICLLSRARVVKLVDAGDSKSPAARRAGSIPAPGTTA